jgi:hypothetical protein
VLYYGLAGATEDIELLVDPAPENIERIKRVPAVLPDHAAQDPQACPLRITDVGLRIGE